jgi:hypothetical protein
VERDAKLPGGFSGKVVRAPLSPAVHGDCVAVNRGYAAVMPWHASPTDLDIILQVADLLEAEMSQTRNVEARR